MDRIDLEEWKPIVGFEGLYEVSNLGNVRSISRLRKGKGNSFCWHKGKILKPQLSYNGYCRVGINDSNGKQHIFSVHKLVALAFVPNLHNEVEINHKDENKTNNIASNLEWCSPSYNINYGTRNTRVAAKMAKPVVITRLVDGKEFYFKSISEAKRCGFGTVALFSKQKNKQIRYGGYHWRYADEQNFVIPTVIDKRKPIIANSILGDSIMEFESLHDAERKHYSRNSIKSALKEGRSYRGYYWKYKQ